MYTYCKLQICCLVIICIIFVAYYQGKNRLENEPKNPVFDSILGIGILEIIFDGISAVTVNHLDVIPLWANNIIHAFFYLTLDTEIFLLFLYINKGTDSYPKKNHVLQKFLIYFPFAVNLLTVILFSHKISYIEGKNTNYSLGISAYTCFLMVGIYSILIIYSIFSKIKYLSNNMRVQAILFLSFYVGIAIVQMIFPESLLTSAAILVIVLGIFLNLENPLYKEVSDYNEEMVLGFSTLVENRDEDTGGHIFRTSAYAEALARELRRNGKYSKILTTDYINYLRLAAPIHDIGKIAIPDAILQKPAKLTDEEFNIMKTHAFEGGKIVEKTFGHTSNKDYTKMAFEVATYHHERWNGKGYPNGLSQEEIPLSARIMAVADVFDAISEKRCYKEAIPLPECFEIIKNGSGTDFDPIIADTFINMKDDIIKIRSSISKQMEHIENQKIAN